MCTICLHCIEHVPSSLKGNTLPTRMLAQRKNKQTNKKEEEQQNKKQKEKQMTAFETGI